MTERAHELLSPSGEKVTLHSCGDIDITAAPGSPIHVHKRTGEMSSDLTPTEELQQLKDTLRKLTIGDAEFKIPSQNLDLKPDTPESHGSSSRPTYRSPLSTFSHSPYLRSSTMSPYSSPRNATAANASSSGPSNSKAMLSALRALQDKLRRVEAEKEEAVKKCTDLKVDMKKQEAEILTHTKKSAYEISQARESARAAYEALRVERDELKLQLVKSNEECKMAGKELSHLQTRVTSLEDSLRDKNERLRISDEHNEALKRDLHNSATMSEQKLIELQQKRETEERSMYQTEARLGLYEKELAEQRAINSTLSTKLSVTESALTNMVDINEKLVAQLGSRPKTKSRKKVSTITRSTAASRASQVTQKAINIIGRKKPKSSNASRSKALKSGNNMDKLKKANRGQVPFILGQSTKPSFSVIASVQQAMANTDTFAAVAPDRKSSMPEPHRPVFDEYQERKKASEPTAPDTSLHINVPHLQRIQTPVNATGEANENTTSKKADALSLAANSIESEYESLSKRYSELVDRVQKNQQDGDTKNMTESVSDLNKVIDSLESKSQQLHWVKAAQKQSGKKSFGTASPLEYERSVIHSPEAIKRKTAALSLLREYREMDRSMR